MRFKYTLTDIDKEQNIQFKISKKEDSQEQHACTPVAGCCEGNGMNSTNYKNSEEETTNVNETKITNPIIPIGLKLEFKKLIDSSIINEVKGTKLTERLLKNKTEVKRLHINKIPKISTMNRTRNRKSLISKENTLEDVKSAQSSEKNMPSYEELTGIIQNLNKTIENLTQQLETEKKTREIMEKKISTHNHEKTIKTYNKFQVLQNVTEDNEEMEIEETCTPTMTDRKPTKHRPKEETMGSIEKTTCEGRPNIGKPGVNETQTKKKAGKLPPFNVLNTSAKTTIEALKNEKMYSTVASTSKETVLPSQTQITTNSLKATSSDNQNLFKELKASIITAIDNQMEKLAKNIASNAEKINFIAAALDLDIIEEL
ncbi:hypothetical protein KPH14_008568 [Odynerus spinipes]|uniref:Uncharacterized protein n=1 Tax=Odynerus spinipes TaxID=1348599 RepID=A0AAD9VS59_9HYME|nr:hypothetical protein KPH14_008568 [Odynerus spinipes]